MATERRKIITIDTKDKQKHHSLTDNKHHQNNDTGKTCNVLKARKWGHITQREPQRWIASTKEREKNPKQIPGRIERAQPPFAADQDGAWDATRCETVDILPCR